MKRLAVWLAILCSALLAGCAAPAAAFNLPIRNIPNLASVHGVLAVPSLHRVFASATGDNQVAVIDESTLAVIQRIPVGEYLDGLAYDPDIRQIYVSNENGATVSVVDTQKNAFVCNIEIGGEVGNTQYDAAGKTIYSADQTDDQLVAALTRREGGWWQCTP